MTIIHVNDKEELQRLCAEHRLVVVDFTATWCGPCQHMAPIFETLSEKFNQVKFLKVDVDRVDTKEYGIRSIPAFQFYRDGRKICHTGFLHVENLSRENHCTMVAGLWAGTDQVAEFAGSDPKRLEQELNNLTS